MAALPILAWPDPRLRAVCAPLLRGSPALGELAGEMLETMYAAPGRGLAAPQVGIMVRLFVMDVGWKDGAPSPVVMIDPAIEESSEALVTGTEGCLSLPGVSAEVTRAAEVRMRWLALDGSGQSALLRGPEAICAQHELDHLNGLTILDRVGPEHRAELIAACSAARP